MVYIIALRYREGYVSLCSRGITSTQSGVPGHCQSKIPFYQKEIPEWDDNCLGIGNVYEMGANTLYSL